MIARQLRRSRGTMIATDKTATGRRQVVDVGFFAEIPRGETERVQRADQQRIAAATLSLRER